MHRWGENFFVFVLFCGLWSVVCPSRFVVFYVVFGSGNAFVRTFLCPGSVSGNIHLYVSVLLMFYVGSSVD